MGIGSSSVAVGGAHLVDAASQMALHIRFFAFPILLHYLDAYSGVRLPLEKVSLFIDLWGKLSMQGKYALCELSKGW